MRSICSDGAKVGANFEHGAGEKVISALFCVPLHLGKMERRVILKPRETAIFHDLQKSKETSTMKFKTPLVASGLMLSILTLNAQVQIGAGIVGENFINLSGNSVSMPDANTLAIGAPWNNGNGSEAGHVRAYSWSGTAWVQKGVDIDGEAANDHSGCSVSMPDANTLAIGAYGNNGNGIEAGHVRVYSWSGTAWVQKGVDIDGEAGGDLSGHAVSMPDANTLAIGAFRNDGFLPLPDAGHTRVYSWSGTAWGQKGVDINGWSPYNQSGYSVSMPDANILAIGTPAADSGRGHTVVYSLATIGDAENSLLATLKLYPNPASSVINVEVDAEHFDVPYSIYDNTGRIVLKGKLNSELTSIVLGDLSDGVYTISVGEDIRQTFKVNK